MNRKKNLGEGQVLKVEIERTLWRLLQHCQEALKTEFVMWVAGEEIVSLPVYRNKYVPAPGAQGGSGGVSDDVRSLGVIASSALYREGWETMLSRTCGPSVP